MSLFTMNGTKDDNILQNVHVLNFIFVQRPIRIDDFVNQITFKISITFSRQTLSCQKDQTTQDRRANRIN